MDMVIWYRVFGSTICGSELWEQVEIEPDFLSGLGASGKFGKNRADMIWHT